MKKNLLRMPDPAEGPGSIVTDQVPPAPPAAPAPPPAALTVLQGEEDEETIKLRGDLERERLERKKVEQEAATLADENHRLKQAGLQPAPKNDSRSALEKFMDGEDV